MGALPYDAFHRIRQALTEAAEAASSHRTPQGALESRDGPSATFKLALGEFLLLYEVNNQSRTITLQSVARGPDGGGKLSS
jgi:mRNA-degrading endonuclease RelE of RelBE toxin-antitoxin system